MRVLYVLDEQGGGGSFHSLREMIRQLSRRHGVEPVLLASRESEHVSDLRDDGVPVVLAPYGSFMQSRPSAAWKVPVKYVGCAARYWVGAGMAPRKAEEGFDLGSVDLVHSNINRVDVGATIAARHGVPHVQHIREFGDSDFACWSYRRMPGKHVSDGADAVICISNAVRDHWVRTMGLDPSKARVVYNGVDQSRFVPKAERGDGMVRFVMVGNLIEAKGQLTAVRAFAALPPELRGKAALDLYGEGSEDYMSRIRDLIDQSGLKGSVSLRGRTDDVPEVLSHYDVGIVGSRAEGFGRVTVEYLAAGLDVLATDAGANREILTDSQGEIGRFFRYGDAEELSRLMAEAIAADYNLEDYMRNTKRAGEFTAQKNAEGVWQVYEDALALHAGV